MADTYSPRTMAVAVKAASLAEALGQRRRWAGGITSNGRKLPTIFKLRNAARRWKVLPENSTATDIPAFHCGWREENSVDHRYLLTFYTHRPTATWWYSV